MEHRQCTHCNSYSGNNCDDMSYRAPVPPSIDNNYYNYYNNYNYNKYNNNYYYYYCYY